MKTGSKPRVVGKHGPEKESWHFQIFKDGEENTPALRQEIGRMVISLGNGHYQNSRAPFGCVAALFLDYLTGIALVCLQPGHRLQVGFLPNSPKGGTSDTLSWS